MIPDIARRDSASNGWRKTLPFILIGACFCAGSPVRGQDWRRQPAVYTQAPSPQANSTPSDCSAPVRLPVVPMRERRSATGSGPDQTWQTELDPNSPPTAAFVEAMDGNDATIELVVNQGRLLTLKGDISTAEGTGVIAMADPTVFDFDLLKPRILRLTGRRVGVTDLSIMTADGETYSFEVRVGYDLELLKVRLSELFPDAYIRLSQIREHLIVQGEARSVRQVNQILQTLEAFLASVQVPSSSGGGGGGGGGRSSPGGRGEGDAAPRQAPGSRSGTPGMGGDDFPEVQGGRPDDVVPEEDSPVSTGGSFVSATIINLLRVPGVHQVMLQVQIAEVDRTGLREIGADILRANPGVGNILATQIGGGGMSGSAATGGEGGFGLVGTAAGAMSAATQVFGVFPSGDFEILLRALRQNQLATVLAEPNLVAMSGQTASFLSGGEFPVPVPQTSGSGGTVITVEFKQFGVQLDFVPYVLEDETVRLTVRSEASTIDDAIGAVVSGFAVPGVNTRSVTTTVEMRQGQTLGIAGLLSATTVGTTNRIPLLGDLPYIGPMFSSTSHKRVEKELLILVTPYLVAPMDPDQVPCLPGQEIEDPNDLEFYLLNRIAGRTGRGHDASRNWDDPLGLVRLLHLEQRSVCGPVGFTPYAADGDCAGMR